MKFFKIFLDNSTNNIETCQKYWLFKGDNSRLWTIYTILALPTKIFSFIFHYANWRPGYSPEVIKYQSKTNATRSLILK